MANGRSIEATVLYNGLEVGLSRKLESLSYTDNASGTSDETTLTFEERSAAWIRDVLRPEKGADLDVTLYFNNWKRSGDRLKYHCGNFTLDDLTYSAPPRCCVLKGVSIPANDGFKTTEASKTWTDVTLRQIAEEIKNKYGMTNLHYWGPTPEPIFTIEQDKKPDSTFLAEVCDQQGMFLKIYKKALVIFDKTIYEARGITKTFYESDMEEGYTWNDTLSGTYTGAKLVYTSTSGSGKKKKAETISVEVGDGPRWLELDNKVESEADAIRICKAKANEANEKATILSFSALADPNIVATCNIELKGMGAMDGKYFVTKVTHRLSGKHSMKVSAYKIFNRL
ncbi:MAG: hypothetical protein PHV18_04275 [Lachnospiraceae bacterium]|nr:hypothetical protein [Lachnospiraceae bacterium]